MPVKRERDSSDCNNSMITTGSSYVLAGVREQFAACSPSVCTLFANVFVKHSSPKRLYTKLSANVVYNTAVRESFRSDRFFTLYFRKLMSRKNIKERVWFSKLYTPLRGKYFSTFRKLCAVSSVREKIVQNIMRFSQIFARYIVSYIWQSRRWIFSPFTNEIIGQNVST